MSNVFDPGKKDRRLATQRATEGLVNQFGAQGPAGVSAGFQFDPKTGTGQTQFGLGDFEPLLQGSLDVGTLGLNQVATGGVAGAQAFAGAQPFQQGLGDIFQSSLSTALADPFDLGADISSRLRQLSERRNQRGVNKFFDRLKRTGNLTSSAGVQRAGDLERGLFEQGLQFDLQGLQAGRGIQKEAFGRAMGSQQGAQGLSEGLIRQFLESQQVGANIGFGGIAAAQNLSLLPTQFLASAQSATGLASGTRFGAADVSTNQAAMARSPLGEAIKLGLSTIKSAGTSS